MIAKLRAMPPWLWIVLSGVVGLAALTWLRYAQDDDDTDWTTAKETQPPTAAPFPAATGGTGRTTSAFRGRSYPDTLSDASFSIVGEF